MTKKIIITFFLLASSFVVFPCNEKGMIFHNKESGDYILFNDFDNQISYYFRKDYSKNIYYRYNITELSKSDSTINFELGDEIIIVYNYGQIKEIKKEDLSNNMYIFLYVLKESFRGTFLNKDTIEFATISMVDDSNFRVRYFHNLNDVPQPNEDLDI